MADEHNQVGEGGSGTAASSESQIIRLHELRKAVGSGASWFYWIAGLSLVNTIIAASGGSLNFSFGLGITGIVDVFISRFGATAVVLGVIINVAIATVCGMFGYFAARRQRWAFIVGMACYALDGLLCLLLGAWLEFAFHVFALLMIWAGLKADTRLREIEARAAANQEPQGWGDSV